MKLISWNVNGLRACLNKGFGEFFEREDADIFCVQETKLQEGQADLERSGYHLYLSSAQKKGYAGTLVYTKKKPLSVTYGIDGKYSDEGRVITLEFENFYFVVAYVPNSQEGLRRLDYRMVFEDDMREFLLRLKSKKPVIFAGDLNVAHREIDIKNPKANVKNPGFTKEERGKFDELLLSGMVDTFRYKNPDKVEYSWWSYRFNARANNSGWRIDYFLVSSDIASLVQSAEIRTEVMGSDHAPVVLEINL